MRKAILIAVVLLAGCKKPEVKPESKVRLWQVEEITIHGDTLRTKIIQTK